MSRIVVSRGDNFDEEVNEKQSLVEKECIKNNPNLETKARPINKLRVANITDEVVNIMEQEDEDFNHYICTLMKLDQVILWHQSLSIKQRFLFIQTNIFLLSILTTYSKIFSSA